MVYPVEKFDTLLSLPLSKSRPPGVLSDAVPMYPTSTAEDLYRVLKHKGIIFGLSLTPTNADFARTSATPHRRARSIDCSSIDCTFPSF